VKVAEQKEKKRKKRATSPLANLTPSIPTPYSREVESEEEEEEKKKDEAIEELSVPKDQAAKRLESLAAKRQRELVKKTSEDALRRGLEPQRSAVATQVRMPTARKPRVFWPKARLPVVMRYNLEGWFCLCTLYLIFVLTRCVVMQAGGKATRGASCPIVSLPHEVA
jgi:hypothetical protein